MGTQSNWASASVTEILTKYSQGSSKDFDVFVASLQKPDISDDVLLHHLRGLRECVGSLSKEFELLVGVILKVRWFDRDVKIIKEYQAFVVNLVSAHTIYLQACLRMIVKNFIQKVDKDVQIVEDSTKDQHEQIFLHLHTLMKSLLQLVPLAPSVLLPLLSDSFPYLTVPSYTQYCYVRNLLHITTYLASHRMQILQLVVEHVTKLDVRAPRGIIQDTEADDDADDEMEAIFDMDELNAGAVMDAAEADGPMAHPEADRLDVLMDLLFTYIHGVCHQNGDQLQWEASKKLYRELLTIFENIVLPTHACCHIQYIMFYICSFKEPLIEGFLDYLWKKVQSPNTQPIFRQAAVAYTASLLARAKYIDISLVRACLELLVHWVHYYIGQASYTKVSPAHHGPFYSVCQAVFYVFAFKHRELLAMPNGEKFCQSLGLQTIVTCRLNPLKMCLPVVAQTFCSVTRQHQLAFCDTILEKNKRNTLPEAGSNPNANPLEAFFPFDPYVLKRSGRVIEPIYSEYVGAVVEEQKAPVEEEADYLEAAAAVEKPASPSDFILYGSSPGFKTMIGLS